MLPRWKQLKTDAAARARMEQRSAAIAAVRGFFSSRGFLEVETPILVKYPGMEPNLDVFATRLRRDDGAEFAGHLITSPEYSMKKLLAAGFPRIFEITRCFRNSEPWNAAGAPESGEGPATHNPEFTMIEWYRANADYKAIMSDTEEMAAEAAAKISGSTRVSYQGTTIDLAPPWPKMTMAEAFERFVGLDLAAGIDEPERFRREAAAKGATVTPGDSWDDIFYKMFIRDIEPKLGRPEKAGGPSRPVIIYEYPRSQAALARLKPGDGRFAERFEAYAGGLELANAFSELNDAAEQRRRLQAEAAQRRAAGRSPWAIDEQFLEAVGMMPPSAGIALGLDRLVMLLTDVRDIRDVLFFPVSDMFD